MEREILIGAITVLTAKILADTLRRGYGFDMPNVIGSARKPIEVDIVYLIALAACLVVVNKAGLAAGLLIAILIRLSHIISFRVVLPGNHVHLELLVAIICFRLLDQPGALPTVLQIVTASVWVYAAFQKVYHREFLDGSFFYTALQANSRRTNDQWWSKFIPRIPPLRGYYDAINPAGQEFCRRLAVGIVAVEFAFPLIALVATGTLPGFLIMLALSLPVGLLTRETNFMISNVLLSLTFLIPFDIGALSTIASDPVVLGIVVWCLIWPPVHAVLTRRYRFSSWKLAGWGMYATQIPRVEVVDPRGRLLTTQSGPPIPAAMLPICGASRIRWLREYTSRSFFRWCHKDPANGLLFRWYRQRQGRYVTECVWLPNQPGATPKTFEVSDKASVQELWRCLAGSAPPEETARPSAFVDTVA